MLIVCVLCVHVYICTYACTHALHLNFRETFGWCFSIYVHSDAAFPRNQEQASHGFQHEGRIKSKIPFVRESYENTSHTEAPLCWLTAPFSLSPFVNGHTAVIPFVCYTNPWFCMTGQVYSVPIVEILHSGSAVTLRRHEWPVRGVLLFIGKETRKLGLILNPVITDRDFCGVSNCWTLVQLRIIQYPLQLSGMENTEPKPSPNIVRLDSTLWTEDGIISDPRFISRFISSSLISFPLQHCLSSRYQYCCGLCIIYVYWIFLYPAFLCIKGPKAAYKRNTKNNKIPIKTIAIHFKKTLQN